MQHSPEFEDFTENSLFKSKNTAESAQDRVNSAENEALSHPLDGLTEMELLLLRDQINERLPVKHLHDLNLTSELVLQLRRAQATQQEILENEGEESQKKTGSIATTARVINDLVSLQNSIYTGERLKRIEGHLIRTLETLPRELLLEFFEAYEGFEFN